MESLIILIKLFFIKTKMFWYGFAAGGLFHWFELDIGKQKFNVWKFLVSSTAFWLLTQFSYLAIQGEVIVIEGRNDSKDIVLSVLLASFLFLFIPFVMKPENRGRFIESVLAKFGFIKKGDNKKD